MLILCVIYYAVCLLWQLWWNLELVLFFNDCTELFFVINWICDLLMTSAAWEWLGCWTCDHQTTASDLGRRAVESWPGYLHTCSSVTKQYNLAPTSGCWWLVDWKVTVGLASHWPCVTSISGSPPTGWRMSTCLRSLVEYDERYLLINWRLCEWTQHVDIVLFSTRHSVVFYFRSSVYWWKGSVRF